MIMGGTETTFDAMWADLTPIGLGDDGGYRRFAWTAADAALREWFAAEARRRGLSCDVDHAGNQWAWWGDPDTDGPGVVTGSHLDSVPGGGAFDGPLGVVSAFAAIDLLRDRGWTPPRPVGVAAFADEEGARFGIACAGSRLLTGDLDPGRALALTDADGITLAEAMRGAGLDPSAVGADHNTLHRIATFVELHVEQGRGLVERNRPVGVASSIWPHGRWRVTLAGEANHAGTTLLADRDDPMLELAALIQAVRAGASDHAALATVGKVQVDPGGVNAIPSQVQAWLDCRAKDAGTVRAVVNDLARFDPVLESWTPPTVFDADLASQVAAAARADGQPAPMLGTGAGHDAGILSATGIPTAMLFVRNPTGISHSPAEFAHRDDCLAGVTALADTLMELSR